MNVYNNNNNVLIIIIHGINFNYLVKEESKWLLNRGKICCQKICSQSRMRFIPCMIIDKFRIATSWEKIIQ